MWPLRSQWEGGTPSGQLDRSDGRFGKKAKQEQKSASTQGKSHSIRSSLDAWCHSTKCKTTRKGKPAISNSRSNLQTLGTFDDSDMPWATGGTDRLIAGCLCRASLPHRMFLNAYPSCILQEPLPARKNKQGWWLFV